MLRLSIALFVPMVPFAGCWPKVVSISLGTARLGTPSALPGTFLDITDRKQSRGKGTCKRGDYTKRPSNSHVSVRTYLTSPKDAGRVQEVLDRLFDIPLDYARTVEGWGNFVHPDERQAMLDYLRDEVIGKHKPFDREYRIVRFGDNQVRWVHGLGRLEFDASGAPHSNARHN